MVQRLTFGLLVTGEVKASASSAGTTAPIHANGLAEELDGQFNAAFEAVTAGQKQTEVLDLCCSQDAANAANEQGE